MTLAQDKDADAVVATMVASSLAMSAVPTVNTVAFIGAMGAGVVAIGAIYGYKLAKDESWKLVKQFLQAAGFATGAAFATGKVIGLLLATTGIGYGAAVAIDAAVGSGTAYALGMAAKHYFKNDRNMEAAAKAYRDAAHRRRTN
jgi:uncharacterized protein (DUF697 family)